MPLHTQKRQNSVFKTQQQQHQKKLCSNLRSEKRNNNNKQEKYKLQTNYNIKKHTQNIQQTNIETGMSANKSCVVRSFFILFLIFFKKIMFFFFYNFIPFLFNLNLNF